MITEIPYKDRDEWIKIRKNYIGGSDAGAVVGMNQFSSPYELWAEKTGKIPGFDGNVTTQVGAYLEEFVAKMFEEQTGKKVRRKNRILVNDLYPWASANVDRVIVGEKAILEIKTTNSLPAMRLFAAGEYPEHWYCQVTHYLAVTGLEKAYIAVLIGCREFRVFEVERNQNEIDALMNAEKEFWRHVTENTPPPADGTDATSETLSTIYAEEHEGEVSLIGLESHFDAITEINAQMKELERMKTEHENEIKSVMQESTVGRTQNYSVTWKAQSRKSFDTAKFQQANPGIDLAPFYKESTSRVFKIKKT